MTDQVKLNMVCNLLIEARELLKSLELSEPLRDFTSDLHETVARSAEQASNLYDAMFVQE